MVGPVRTQYGQIFHAVFFWKFWQNHMLAPSGGLEPLVVSSVRQNRVQMNLHELE